MSLAIVYSRALLGVDALTVTVETHLSNGLPAFNIVGLPETAVKESKERVRSAILNSGLEFPARRITVNLAPADLPKTGGRYDLAIALSVLAAAGQIPSENLHATEILGELALDGSIRPVQGIVPAIMAARRDQRRILLPEANKDEMDLVAYENAYCLLSLIDYIDHANNGASLRRSGEEIQQTPIAEDKLSDLHVRGQIIAKRAVQIAAAGGHNLLMIGPPGCGKTLLANAMVRLLPNMSEQEALEVAAVNSISNTQNELHQWRQRPIRCPHHSATAVALVGGGNRAKPGEITLAHNGVLFLDELTEFKQGVLDSLREPLEAGQITISRANYRMVLPAKFQLLAAMNPCPCGHANNPRKECRCTTERIARYIGKLSGPLLDRLDLFVELSSLTQAELLQHDKDETDWPGVKNKIARCRELQMARGKKLNAELTVPELASFCSLQEDLQKGLAETIDRLGLSARAMHRLIKVARTIADYEASENIAKSHLIEAVSFRRSQISGSVAA